jgi:hypothetical protein
VVAGRDEQRLFWAGSRQAWRVKMLLCKLGCRSL